MQARTFAISLRGTIPELILSIDYCAQIIGAGESGITKVEEPNVARFGKTVESERGEETESMAEHKYVFATKSQSHREELHFPPSYSF
jgi:hypothetical protein